MGDRCYIELTCRESDAPIFERMGFLDQGHCVNDGPGTVRLTNDQGYWCDFPENIPFIGEHSAGHEYGPCLYACDGRDYMEVLPGNDGPGEVFVRVDPDGSPNVRALLDVADYYAITKRARAMLGFPEDR